MARGSLLRVEAAPPPPEFFGNGPVKGDLEPVTVTWFLLNTAGNREFLAGLEKGEIQIEDTNLLVGVDLWDKPLPDAAASGETPRNSAALSEIKKWNKQRQWRVRSSRPDIYTLYEQNIGALTPILSERLREAENLYPAAWIEEAFAEAVNYNRRSWAYIIRILENWVTNGRERNQTVERSAERSRPKPGQGNSAAQRARGNGRTGLAGDGTAAPGTTAPGPANGTSGGSSTPSSRRGPIDFTKYTTGKYAHLTEPGSQD
ncbi:MAG: DnaD domain protein [Chloroflexi bacterium]|nr:DnaD domain protein [Chloroflexota bacterium]